MLFSVGTDFVQIGTEKFQDKFQDKKKWVSTKTG